ncbi:MAG TPA: flagellar motor switch protein FliN, partial [Paraburkholderia sp.]
MSDVNGTNAGETPDQGAQDAQAAVSAADDWAAALAEQTVQETAAAAPAAPVFQPLSKVGATTTHNDIDMILDIPVQMTVELGRTRIAI